MAFPGYADWINTSSTKWVQRSENLLENSKNEMCDTKNPRTLLGFLRPVVPVTEKNTMFNTMGFYITFRECPFCFCNYRCYIANILITLMWTKLKIKLLKCFSYQSICNERFSIQQINAIHLKRTRFIQLLKLFKNHGVTYFNSFSYNIKVVG